MITHCFDYNIVINLIGVWDFNYRLESLIKRHKHF